MERRKIRFRCWHLYGNRWLDTDLYPDNESYSRHYMQYIDRKDKYGKELCEGDIVKIIIDLMYPPHSYTGIITFQDCSFVIKSPTDTHYHWMDYDLELLGNIYDNPDLTKELDNELEL